jgi:parallel beta-helix repeat protein
MIATVACFALIIAAQATATTSAATDGSIPPASFGERDVVSEFKLPRLKDQPDDLLMKNNSKLQVLLRSRLLHVNAHSPAATWRAAEETFAQALAAATSEPPKGAVIFDGTLASQLNVLLSRADIDVVVVAASELQLDVPIQLSRTNVRLDLGRARLQMKTGSPYMIRIEGVKDVQVRGGVLTSGPWGVLISNSQQVSLIQMRLDHLAGGGVLITGSDHVVIWQNKFERLGAAPVLLHRSTHHSTVAENEMSNNLGSSNWSAGVVLTDRTADLAADPTNLLNPDRYWVKEQPMAERVAIPHDNVVAYNRINGNLSSGIYSDGSASNVIIGNDVERNSKEGMCLDNGSVANVVAWNLFRSNGKRWGESDLNLKQDFIFGLGRLPDGSSPAKVPAISIDNAAYNQVVFNEVDRNFGGGIKMVRTDFYNVIGLNVIADNNEGQSKKFHFFGIELGSAGADAPSKELDFTASRGNEVFGNTIRGSHYAGVFFASGSDNNAVFDNSIFGATFWAMESVRVQPNMTLNNLTNLKSRNIGSGIDPHLLLLGAPQVDANPGLRHR